MELDEITEFIDNKIKEDSNKVVVSFFELKVKRGLTNEILLSTTNLIAIKLSNMGYKVYRTGQKYIYENEEHIIESNVLLVAIK